MQFISSPRTFTPLLFHPYHLLPAHPTHCPSLYKYFTLKKRLNKNESKKEKSEGDLNKKNREYSIRAEDGIVYLKKRESVCHFFYLHILSPSATPIASAIRWYLLLPPSTSSYSGLRVLSSPLSGERETEARTRINVDMIINIHHRRIPSRITTDIPTPLSPMHPHDHRR